MAKTSDSNIAEAVLADSADVFVLQHERSILPGRIDDLANTPIKFGGLAGNNRLHTDDNRKSRSSLATKPKDDSPKTRQEPNKVKDSSNEDTTISNCIEGSVLNEVGVDGPEVQLEFSTVLARETVNSRKIAGLTVRGVNKTSEITLPETYTQEDCAWLGGIVAIVEAKVNEESDEKYVVVNRIITHEANVGPDRRICHLALRAQVKEIMFNQMFELDFSERSKEEQPLSYEDKMFIKKAKKGIHQREDDDSEVRRISTLVTEVKELADIEEGLRRFSSWYQAKRAISLCLRFRKRLTSQLRQKSSSASDGNKPKRKEIEDDGQTNPISKDLKQLVNKSIKATRQEKLSYKSVTVDKLQDAESEIIKIVQNKAFDDEIVLLRHLDPQNITPPPGDVRNQVRKTVKLKKSSSIYQLDPFLGKDGIPRVGGRIRRASVPENVKHICILSRKGRMTEPVICHHHQKVAHQGRGMTHNNIRSSGF
ncbi:Hypothetical predicted protein [Paramuricea clavata]|uniref:Uncharacterized protein n=1 Tax=Paramuricea clavata TaxID=317549 RepID=A0A6S7HWK1_PARCT|nr:Hypothetical predicted protein [Paramuricea clavata]